MWLLDRAVIVQMAWIAGECGWLVVRELGKKKEVIDPGDVAVRVPKQGADAAGHSFIWPRGATWQ